MRFHFAIALSAAALLLSANAYAAATAQQSSMKTCAASWSGMSAADKAKTKYKDYMSSCMKAPAAAPAKTTAAAPAPMMMKAKPAKAETAMKMAAPAGGGSAKCKDGKVVTYKNRSGTCSGHGGVATWM